MLFAIAVATDYLDGSVARRSGGETAHGAVLDNLGDVAFVLAGTGTAAALGLLAHAVPVAIGVSFTAYAVASVRRSAAAGAARLAYSPLGHAAGVCNYLAVGLVTAVVARPGHAWASVLDAAGVAVVGVNLAAVVARLTPARAPRGGGSRAR